MVSRSEGVIEHGWPNTGALDDFCQNQKNYYDAFLELIFLIN